ncbi:MAG TPA: hypothetical protein VFH97_02750 [Gemmatimonadales bacterium]|nr:hypothetical protein [Gemmatimonadales bacterium]
MTKLLVSLLLLAAPAASAQLIALKTVPVAAGDQYLFAPSQNLAMGGVHIALDDPLLDPFVNPAMASRVTASQVFALPTFYSVSQHAGNGKTLSAGALFGGRRAFGGMLLALQQISGGDLFFGPIPLREVASPTSVFLPPDALSERSATNKYAYLTLGTTLPGGVAVGASALLSDLNAVDGVEHLYAMAADIDQSGHDVDLRLGALKELPRGSLELLLLHRRYDVRHDVTYLDWVLDSTDFTWEQQVRLERNDDRTNTSGAHLRYVRALGEGGWRLGGIFTANRKSHPRIPNYELVNIPRDPGHSTAFDFGIGLARTAGIATFGMDIVYEPAWSDTWAEAATPVPTAGGDTIPVGGRTVENDFTFSNAAVNLGVGVTQGVATFQLGVSVRAYDYDLEQADLVAGTFRRQSEQWMEWTPSWGLRVDLPGVAVRYLGRVTTGTGRPGVAWTGAVPGRAEDFAAANDIVAAPSGPLTLQDVSVVTHQFSVSVPIR